MRLIAQITKSLSDGIGTAAGVAWPLFGILFGTLGLTLGGTAAIILGSCCIGIFILVITMVTYWMYRSYHNENKIAPLKIQEQEIDFDKKLSEYFIDLLKKYLLDNHEKNLYNVNSEILLQYVKNQIYKNRNEISLSSDLKDTFKNLFNKSENITILKEFISNNKNKICLINKSPLKNNKIDSIFFKKNLNNLLPTKIMHTSNGVLLRSGMIGFFAAFGSIAGCAAGTIGLFAGMGVFAGLAAFPFVGWIALGASLIFGLIVAGICAYWSYARAKKNTLIAYYNSTNSGLNLLHNITNNEIKMELKIRKKYQIDTKDDSLMAKKSGHCKRLKRSRSADLSLLYKNHPLWNEINTVRPRHASRRMRHYPVFK